MTKRGCLSCHIVYEDFDINASVKLVQESCRCRDQSESFMSEAFVQQKGSFKLNFSNRNKQQKQRITFMWKNVPIESFVKNIIFHVKKLFSLMFLSEGS